MSVDYLLHESPVGYAVFKANMQSDTVGARLKEVQEKAQNLGTFGKMVQLVSFTPFSGASEALENQNDISEGITSNLLKSVLEMNLPKSKKQKVVLGVQDRGLAGSIKAAFPYVECETAETSELVADMLRNLRLHAGKLLKQLQEGDVERAQLGLGHAYSRAKVKFSVQKNDNHIIQAIATLDHLDKAVNTFSMRVREWYSWHFPELVKLVSDNQTYARVALFVGDKTTLSDDRLHDLAAVVNDDETIARSIIDAARVSMGRDMSDADMEHVMDFAKRAVSLSECRKGIHAYLVAKMGVVAPNTASLIGEMVGARLISKAGSLTNLAKLPASTVQILGAEKALFRALKTKGNTPKYGLIYHSSLIGRSAQKNKGRISRFLANKTSIASRIDNFSEVPTSIFGQTLRRQVEERLEFFASGAPPTKNEMAMKSAMDTVLAEMDIADPTAGAASDEEMADGVTAQATQQKQRHKKDKKEKKSKNGHTKDANGVQPHADMMDIEIKDPAVTSEKKEKKSKRHSEVNGTADAKAEKKKRKYGEVDGEGKKKKKRKHE